MKFAEKTYVSEILKEYGDIAEVMEMFGVKGSEVMACDQSE